MTRSRLPILLLVLWLCALALIPRGPILAETVLERIGRTGTLTAGTRNDAPPFAFRDKQGRLVGFSVDLIEEVRKALATRFARAIRT